MDIRHDKADKVGNIYSLDSIKELSSFYDNSLPERNKAMQLYREAFGYANALKSTYNKMDGPRTYVAKESGIDTRTLRRWTSDSGMLTDIMDSMDITKSATGYQLANKDYAKISTMAGFMKQFPSMPKVSSQVDSNICRNIEYMLKNNERITDTAFNALREKETSKLLYQTVSELPIEAQLVAKAVDLAMKGLPHKEAKKEYADFYLGVAAKKYDNDSLQIATATGYSQSYVTKRLPQIEKQQQSYQGNEDPIEATIMPNKHYEIPKEQIKTVEEVVEEPVKQPEIEKVQEIKEPEVEQISTPEDIKEDKKPLKTILSFKD